MNKKNVLIGIGASLLVIFLGLNRHWILSLFRKQPKFVPPRIADRIKDIKVATLPFNLPPTKSQKEALDKLEIKYRDKIIAARIAIENAISPEQMMTIREAAEEAEKAGKQGKELVEAIERAGGKISSEQQQRFKAAQTELNRFSTELQAEISKLLNEDQKKEIKKRIEALNPKK
jgi:hypothetical protein